MQADAFSQLFLPKQPSSIFLCLDQVTNRAFIRFIVQKKS